jgi:hypothetical protein
LTTIGTERAGLSQRWADAIVYTVVLFGTIVIASRMGWHRHRFWRLLLLVFAVHVLALIVVMQALASTWHGIPGLMMLGVGTAEGLVILAILWKKTVAPKNDRHVSSNLQSLARRWHFQITNLPIYKITKFSVSQWCMNRLELGPTLAVRTDSR